MPRSSFFESLRRKSFRRSPSQSRDSSTSAVNAVEPVPANNHGNYNASVNGATEISVNGHTTPASSQAFENGSSFTIDTPESNSGSPSEVSSSEINTTQAPATNVARPSNGSRPGFNGNRISMYSAVSGIHVDLYEDDYPIVVDHEDRASPTLPSPSRLLLRHDLSTWGPGHGYSEQYTATWLDDAYSMQVYQQVILLSGHIGEEGNNTRSGTLVTHHNHNFLPPISSRVVESQFKQMVRLQPGPNFIRLDYIPDPRGSVGSSGPTTHSTAITIHCMPASFAPPLHLAILVASDSNETFDAVPGRIQLEGNNLPVAVRKFRMAGYLWQAFTAEHMRRNNFGLRTFRFEEEWQPTTLTYNPAYADRQCPEAKVHIIRLKQTMKEIRSMEYAQQNKDAQKKGELFSIAMQACRDYFKPYGNQTHYVAAMYLDSHWDPATKVIRGHAALGGGDGQIQLAIFGSHCLQSYPASLDQVNEAFMDATRTDLNFVGNDCGNCGSSWEAANVGIAAHMHEVGHLLGCPHQEGGIMLNDYFGFSRTFCTWEPFATRTGQRAHAVADRNQESFWHRLDCLRFRFHPMFLRPGDHPIPEDTVQAWAVDRGIILTSSAGIAWIEYFAEGEDLCHHFVEYYNSETHSGAKQLKLPLDRLKAEFPDHLKNAKRIRLEVYSMGLNGHCTIDDLYDFVSSSRIRLGGPNTIQSRLSNGFTGTTYAFRGKKLGWSQLEGSQPHQVIFLSVGDLTKVMTSIIVYHGDMVDGLEFVYADGETQLFGKRGGTPGGTEFRLDTRLGEQLFGFYVRAGQWIDGIQIWTTRNRKSEMFGNATGGSG